MGVKNLGKVGSFFQKIIEFVTSVSLVLLSVICFMNVILRYIFKIGLSWSEEVALALFLWIIFLGAILASVEKLHIRVDLIIGLLSKKIRRILEILVLLIVIYALYILFKGSMIFVGNAHKSYSQTMPWLRYSYVYGAIIPSVIGMFIVYIGNLINILRGKELW
ncbi:MAG: TRAP-type transport system small permease protein [Thermoanaerobacteraceae bacterium]|nr:TRAP-type transport system small permease protein [Thermoanaerobacteraceae bacterium]